MQYVCYITIKHYEEFIQTHLLIMSGRIHPSFGINSDYGFSGDSNAVMGKVPIACMEAQ